MLKNSSKKIQSGRWASLDHFRGLAVLLMILVNSLAEYNVPPWLKHAKWNGYTFADLVAPMFLFAMGMAYRISLQKRLASQGVKKTVFHFVKRYTILFLFGFGGLFLVYRRFDWGVLQMLGAIGLFSLPMMFMKPAMGLFVSFVLLLFYQVSVSFLNMEHFVSIFDMGGPFATLSWSFILVTASAFGNRMKNSESRQIQITFLTVGIVFTLAGFLLSFIVPFNKHLVTCSYILFSTGLSSLLFLILYRITDVHRIRIGILESFGKNPLTLFITGNVLVLLENMVIPRTAPVIFSLIGTLLILLICTVLAEILATKNIYIKL